VQDERIPGYRKWRWRVFGLTWLTYVLISGTAAQLWNEEGGGHGGGIFGGYLPARLTSDGDWTPLLYTFIAVLSFSALILTPLWNKAG